MINWREKFLKNDGEDLSERNAIREKQKMEFVKYEKQLAEELDRLFVYHREFQSLKNLFERMGYVIEETHNGVKISKNVYPEQE